MGGHSWFDDDSEDPEPVVEADSNFLAAIESLDVKRIMECWSDEDDTTMLFPGTELCRGAKSIREAWETVARNTRSLRTVMSYLNAMRHGGLGWTFLYGSLISSFGDEALTIEVYITNIFRREEGGWKLIHHHSAPGPYQPAYLEQRMN